MSEKSESVISVDAQKFLNKNDFFIKKAAGKYILTSIISMVFLYAGSLIDTLIVGAFIGESGLAAMSLVGPVYLIYYTFGATIGIGGSILASHFIGNDKEKDYISVYSCTFVLLVAFSIIMTVVGFLFLDPISSFLAGSSDNKQMVHDYLLYYIPGGAMTLLAYIPLYFLKVEGKPKVSSALFFMSAAVNVILSWLFMSDVFDMGIGGASLATTISMTLVVIFGYISLLKNNKALRLSLNDIKKDKIKQIVFTGTPNGLSNLFESLRIMLINMLIIGIGMSAMIPVYTVLRNIMDILSAVIIGVSSALLPLIGVFFGERDHINVRSVLKYSCRIGLIIVTPLVILVSCFPTFCTKIFGVTNAGIINEARWAIPLACAGLVVAYVNTMFIGYFTATKHELLANIMVALRLIIFLVLLSFPLRLIFGIKGIWLAMSLCEVLTLVTYIIINICIRRKRKNFDFYLLDKNHESENEISFSVKNTTEDIVFASEKIGEFCDEHEIPMNKAMRVSLAIEEILVVLIEKCTDKSKEQYIDIRIYKMKDEVMMRFRYVGAEFDPVKYFKENENNEDMEEELLGLKLTIKAAPLVEFKKILGTNNLMIIF